MKAIILAAGYGNRMRPLTDTQHKTLLRIGDRTVIERIIDGLLVNGVKTIIVALGYRAGELSEFLIQRYGQACELVFVLNPRYRETNNIYSLALVFDQCEIDDDIILIESDLIYEPSVIDRLIHSPYDNVALVDRYRSGMDGTVVTMEGDVVTNVIPPHIQGQNFDFSDKFKTLNIYKFSAEFCRQDFKKILTFYSKAIDDKCYYELILGFLIYMQRESIFGVCVEDLKWAEIDDPNDLRIAEFQFDDARKTDILEKAWGGYWSYPVLDFAFIRNMHFPPPSVFSEVRSNLVNLLGNYGSSQAILNEKLAYLILQPPDSVIALNGASQVFPMLESFFEGKRILIPAPSFGEYRRIFPDAAIYVDDGLRLDSNLADALQQTDPEVVVLVNPNNPTGSVIPTEMVCRHILTNPGRFFIVDESFIEFSGEPSVAEMVSPGVRNFLVVKSLSKVLGVPGARLGYAFTNHTELRAFIAAALPIWNMNSVAEFLLEILLKHRNAFSASLKMTIEDRSAFASALRELPSVARVFYSGANFLLIRLKCNADALKKWAGQILVKNQIYAKDISAKFDDGHAYMRVAVRLPAENQRLITVLRQLSVEI